MKIEIGMRYYCNKYCYDNKIIDEVLAEVNEDFVEIKIYDKTGYIDYAYNTKDAIRESIALFGLVLGENNDSKADN